MKVLEGNGLNPGEYHVTTGRDGISTIVKIGLGKQTAWKDILKLIPKNSVITEYKKVG